MPLDPARASFVSQSHRYEVVTLPLVKAKYPGALELTIDTQLSAASAAALAGSISAEAQNASTTFTLMIQEYWSPDLFAGGVPRVILNLPGWNETGRTFKVMAMKADPVREQTELVLRA